MPPSRKLSQSAAVAADGVDAAVLPIMPPFDYIPPPYHGPRAAEIVRKRSEFLSPSISYLYKNPVQALASKLPGDLKARTTRLPFSLLVVYIAHTPT
ncbi:hypothetical protein B296_00042205 [Ensete ventricosum]|uniref:Uncharacterized protein n=1 Tax=Ensete ventricosum TaxID=4639 RepID=A0A426XQX8_ENSVE|nr:hypothetical protein B296_00042205 [Ensete ventricosum]